MSEPRLITPLLANHIMGEPISDHHGVRCCPVMEKDSDHKYIVKIVSIPASSVQLDALLLSGAYHSKEAALRYFKELADDTVEEAKLLQKLSKLEGFFAYDSWQIEPMEDGTGYDVYLLGHYCNTLDRHILLTPMTHLAAVNLGLDLCAALSVCRRNGYLYVDLKPENIIISENKGYLIGDIGFINLRSLKYASLPDKYRSAYTAPEIADAYSSLNSTIDIYAAGLVLYQIYNGGQLPQPGAPMESPAYADYDMAQIILKACAENPEDRWQEPQQMGQALASYMQRTAVNDVPIVPVVIPEVTENGPEVVAEDLPKDEISAEVEEIEETSAETDATVEDAITSEPVDTVEVEDPVDAASDEIPLVEESVDPDDMIVGQPEERPESETSEEEPAQEPAAETDAAEASEPEAVLAPVTEQEALPETDPAREVPQEEEPEQFVIEGFMFDDDLDDQTIADLADAAISAEVSAMLAQADELIAHKTPDPVVAPEPIEIPMPEPILPEPEPKPEPQPEEPEDTPAEEIPVEAPAEPVSEAPVLPEDEEDDEPDPIPVPKRKKKLGCLISVLVLILLLLLLGMGGRYYYENYYLQNITSIMLDGAEDWLTVKLSTDIDNSLLTVVCTDTYGNKLTQKVHNNQATFTSLPSGTTYKITVTIDGRHQLTGTTTTTYTTAAQTSIVGISAIAGDTDGSVILNFTVQGPDSDSWLVKYSADGVEEQTAQCSGHMAIITGLQVGKNYTFRLVPQEELYVVSGDTLEFTSAAVIYAQNLTIHGFENGCLIATWEIPEGMSVASWTVRCYNSTGYDTTFTVTEPSIAIADLDVSQGYTLDVKAEGMTVSKWASISENSITFKDILVDNSDPLQLVITWPYEGTVPEGGWQLCYSVDGSEPVIIPCEKNTCTIEKLVPGGHYSFSFALSEDISVFGGTAECTVADVGTFSGYDVSASDMLISMCKRPNVENWSHSDVAEDAYSTAFAIGDNAGIVLRLTAEYVTSPDEIEVTYIIRDQAGNFVRMDTYTQTWTNLWYQGYCELDLPVLPAAPGSYTLEILFNNAYVTSAPTAFTVS